MNKFWLTLILVVVLLVAGIFAIRFILGGNEDDWIKDAKGIWIKHGNPALIPAEVKEQQDAIDCALTLYQQKKLTITLSSQCLGTCGNYAVDIVHVPRNSEDNLAENQCSDYLEKVSSFIELDKDGNIVRIV